MKKSSRFRISLFSIGLISACLLSLPNTASAEYGQGCKDLLNSTQDGKSKYYTSSSTILSPYSTLIRDSAERAVATYYLDNMTEDKENFCKTELDDLNTLIHSSKSVNLSTVTKWFGLNAESSGKHCREFLTKICTTDDKSQFSSSISKLKDPSFNYVENTAYQYLTFNFTNAYFKNNFEKIQVWTLSVDLGKYNKTELLEEVTKNLREKNIPHIITTSYENFSLFNLAILKIIANRENSTEAFVQSIEDILTDLRNKKIIISDENKTYGGYQPIGTSGLLFAKYERMIFSDSCLTESVEPLKILSSKAIMPTDFNTLSQSLMTDEPIRYSVKQILENASTTRENIVKKDYFLIVNHLGKIPVANDKQIYTWVKINPYDVFPFFISNSPFKTREIEHKSESTLDTNSIEQKTESAEKLD